MRKGARRHRRRPSLTGDPHPPLGTLDRYLRPASSSVPGSPPSSLGPTRALRSRSASLSGTRPAPPQHHCLDPPAGPLSPPVCDPAAPLRGRSGRRPPPLLLCLRGLPGSQPPVDPPASATEGVSAPSAPLTPGDLDCVPERRSWAALLQGLHPSPGISHPPATLQAATGPTSHLEAPLALLADWPALDQGPAAPSWTEGVSPGPPALPAPQTVMSSPPGSGAPRAAPKRLPAIPSQPGASPGPAPTPQLWGSCPDTGPPCSGPSPSPPATPDLSLLLSQIPTKEDFRALVAEVRDACRAEISALRQDLKYVSERVEGLEEAHDSTREYIAQLQGTVAAQSCFLSDLHNHVEDLDNRGRRNNIRVRGLPEATQAEDLPATLEAIFNMMLGEPPSHKIHLDRAHRALRPRPSNGPPRDVICCVTDFCLKERIMTKARSLRHFDFDGAQVQLYQDLSWITLRKRRLLQPLLASLRSAQIPYRWSFPFALQARKDGRSAVLRTHEDLRGFCETLDLPVPALPDWGLTPPPPPLPPVWQPVRGKRPRSNGKTPPRGPAAGGHVHPP